VQPIANPCFANLFFHLFDTSDLDPGSSFRFLRRHAGTNVFGYQQFKMGTNLLVEVHIDAAR
jgi:hypothetical protein